MCQNLPTKPVYMYREGVHGEHVIDFGYNGFVRLGSLGCAATKDAAERIIQELRALQERADAKP